MSRLDKLRNLNRALSPDKVDFSSIDNELNVLKKKLTETVNIQTLDDVSRKIKKFQESIDFGPLIQAFEELKSNINDRDKKILSSFQDRLATLTESIKGVSSQDKEGQSAVLSEISALRDTIKEVSSRKPVDFTPQIQDTEKRLKGLITSLETEIKDKKDVVKVTKDIEELGKSLTVLRNETANRGGSKPLSVNVNSSVASFRYADINFKSDTAIRWVATDDNVNKRVDISASIIAGGGGAGTPGGNDTEIQFNDAGSFGGASVLTWNKNTSILALRGQFQLNGGTSGNVKVQAGSVAGNWTLTLPVNDGSANQVLTTDGNGITAWASVAATGGSGITRNTSIITEDTTAADSASTDYVYFVEATGIRVTLPTAVSNRNLYTIKNTSGSSVLVVAPEGVDGSASALMPSNYESLSFLSNQSVWGVV